MPEPCPARPDSTPAGWVADRARRWGWKPAVDLDTALAELADGLRA